MSQATRADLVLLLVTLLAAAGWIFSKEALAGMPPLLFIGVRFLLAGLLLLFFARGDWGVLSRQGLWPRCLAVGLVMAVALLAWIHGLYYGEHLGEGAFITSLGVVLIPVMARLIYRDRVPLATWLSLPVSHVALIMILEPVWTALLGALWYGESMAPLQWLGCGLIFGAMLISRWRWLKLLVRPARRGALPGG